MSTDPEQLTLGLLDYSDDAGHRYGADLLDLLEES